MTSAPSATLALLGLDVGTSAVKAGLFTPDGVALHRSTAALIVRSPRAGNFELDADEVWDAVVRASRSVLADAGSVSVEGVGVAAAAPTPLVVDREGRVWSPVCTFADARAADDLAAFTGRVDVESHQALTGNPVSVPTCSLLTGLRLARAVPDAGPMRFGHLSTYLVHRLTGRWVMDPTNAAFTGALAMADAGRWSADALAMLGASASSMPDLVPSAAPVGRLTTDAGQQLGIGSSPVVTAGCADTAAAALAVGCVENGDAFESVGTSGVLTVCRDAPPPTLHTMNRPHVVPGRWLSHGAMSSSGAAVSWLRERVLQEGSEACSIAAVSELAQSAPAGSGGVVFLPYLAGERSPVWDPTARAAWVGMTRETTSAHLSRSVFEGAAFALRQLLDLEAEATGARVRELVSVGGGATSAFWSSVKADVTGCVFHRAADGDAAARGAALLAACARELYPDPMTAARGASQIATSRVDPSADRRTRETYDRMFAVYKRVYPALQPLFGPLQQAGESQVDDEAAHQPADVLISNREGDLDVEPA